MKVQEKQLVPQLCNRTLIYLPIIHTQEDMGSFSESIRQATLKKFGEQFWKQKTRLINEVWGEIDRLVSGLDLKGDTIRLYQDGLPVCGRELEIVTEVAESGSLNHQILLRLVEKGAILMGTESPELLLEEYELAKQTLSSNNIGEIRPLKTSQNEMRETLLRRRDRSIAERINSTLAKGETGIIFLGLLHSLDSLLDSDILVRFPLFKPPNKNKVQK